MRLYVASSNARCAACIACGIGGDKALLNARDRRMSFGLWWVKVTIDSIDLWESATTCSDTALLGPSERVFLMF